MIKVLMVCLGNICRSPMAEAVLQDYVQNSKLADKVYVESAGTSGYHEGNLADSRMRKAAQQRGYKLLSRSRQFISDDFENFDYILVMDSSNYKNVTSLDDGGHSHKVFKMLSFSESHKDQDVPDPYYGGEQGFSHVIDLLEESCQNFLRFLEKKLS